MKTVFALQKGRYMKKAGILLLGVALIAAMAGCAAEAGPPPSVRHTLAITSTAGGAVTNPGEGTFTYDEAEVVNLVTEPEAGYRFVNWTGDVGTIAAVNATSTTITMNRTYFIKASFEEIPKVRYDLTINSTAGGQVTVPGEGTFTYDTGTVVELMAGAAEGYEFVNWIGDVGTIADVSAASSNVTMDGNYLITASFEEIPAVQYSLTISRTVGGWVTNPGIGSCDYDEGAVVNLVVTPAFGYSFAGWAGDVSSIANVYASATTITMNGNYSIIAVFVMIRHNLTVFSSAGGWVTTPGAGSFTYYRGAVVNLVASSAIGYRFVNWTGDVGTVANVNSASTTITMYGDYSVRANFIKTYKLTVGSTAGGSVTTPAEGTHTYDVGTGVSLVATPAAGYRFVNWTGDVGTVANVNSASTTITMNGDYSISANFIKIYNLTVGSTAGGTVTTPTEGTHSYDTGTVVSLVATPATGYKFANWTGDVGTVADADSAATTITMTGDYSITANFAKYSTYKFTYDVPEDIDAGVPVEVAVTFQTDVLGDCGYDGVRFKIHATGDGDVFFEAYPGDPAKYHSFTNEGYWGPSAGFSLPAEYTATTPWRLTFSRSGEYTVTFSLIDADTEEVIAGIAEEVEVTVP